jgi:uncharacterized protein YjbI with pentapeptide repeats
MVDKTEAQERDLKGEAPSSLAEVAHKASAIEAVQRALGDAAAIGVSLWLSYLFTLFYLLIAATGVTHRDLLLAHPVKLPFLNIALPLRGFFWLGPVLLLVVHIYVLVHLVLLVGKIRVFDDTLRQEVADGEVRANLRRQLPSNIFVQLLAGPREVREGPIGILLSLIAWLSVILGPLAVLVFFELQFLPFHDAFITWLQRLAVVIDVGVLWILWFVVRRTNASGNDWRKATRQALAGLTLTSVLVIPFVFLIATFPGERLCAFANHGPLRPVRKALVAGDVDLVTRRPTSIWFDRLVLPDFTASDDARLVGEAAASATPRNVSLRARDLRGAVLIGATLQSVDFTGSDLQDARLDYADFRHARMSCAQTSLDERARSEYSCVKLQNAVVNRANFAGVALGGARFEGASLEGAQLQGAWLAGAQLVGASLNGANLRGAILLRANLRGASLFRTELQGASLDYADLRAATLVQAELQGASFQVTQLQGSSLDGSDLRSALFLSAFVWRADSRTATTEGARIVEPETTAKYVCLDAIRQTSDICGWSKEAFIEFRQHLVEQSPKDHRRQEISERIERLNPAVCYEGELEVAKRWIDLTKSRPSYNVHDFERKLARQWVEIGCAADEDPHVLEGLILHARDWMISRFETHSAELARLASAFGKNEKCAGARRGLSEDAISALRMSLDNSPRVKLF